MIRMRTNPTLRLRAVRLRAGTIKLDDRGGAGSPLRRSGNGRISRAATMRIGLYPGTFDPITNGHLDIIGRAVKLVDRLVVGVAINSGKSPLFTLEERVALVKQETADLHRDTEILVEPFDSLLMHFAQKLDATLIVRGLRAVADFEYEFQMTAMNQQLNRDIETVFLMADPRHQAIASKAGQGDRHPRRRHLLLRHPARGARASGQGGGASWLTRRFASFLRRQSSRSRVCTAV